MNASSPNRARWCELIELHLLGTISEAESVELEAALAASKEAREDFRHRCSLDAALRQEAESQPIAIPETTMKLVPWQAWRPMTAAAAGVAIGMFCTSVVFGYVSLRPSSQSLPMPVFDPGFEAMKPLDTGIPHRSEEWGVRSAQVTTAERRVQPKEGNHMLRMQPVLGNEADENFSAGAYQVLDLSQMPRDNMTSMVEAEVTASFAAAGDDKARYIMRVVALDESPESATRDFWAKADKSEVVSMTQRFEALSGADGWQSHSVKIPVPSSARSLVIVISVLVPRHTSTPLAPHYLDDVQVSLILHSNHQTK